MPNRRYVGPYILERNAVRVHGISMTAVILYFLSAMSAGKDRRADTMEGGRLAFRVVQEAVMAWMETPGNRKARTDFYGDPVAEI